MDRPQTMARLREIEARVAGATSTSDSVATAKIRAQLANARTAEPDVVTRREIPSEVLADLFFLLCSRYGIEGDLASKRALRTVQIIAPRSFVVGVFDPIFGESAMVLLEHVAEHVVAVVSDAYNMTTEAPALSIKPRSR